MPQELQQTLERKPDQLLKITDKQDKTFLLQLEFQLLDESRMVYRMLFSFYLIQFSTIDYELFLSSKKGDEVVFAVLGKFGEINSLGIVIFMQTYTTIFL